MKIKSIINNTYFERKTIMENKKIGYAIIGAGGFSRLHTQELCKIHEAEVKVVCDYDLEKAKKQEEIAVSDEI